MIQSKANPKIKFIRKLKDKKFRRESGLFYLEGIRIISEAFKEKWTFNQVFYCDQLIKDNYAKILLRELDMFGVDLVAVDKAVFESFSIKERPQGIAAVIHQFPPHGLNKDSFNHGIWVALDRIQDPGNLGSIMRTINAIGGEGVILIDDCVDPYDISVIRASMGAFFSQIIISLKSDVFFDQVRSNNTFVVGTSDKAQRYYRTITYNNDMILLMGSEREGLSECLINVCQHLVKIPMIGTVDSLNLASATSICLYEIFHQIHNSGNIV